ncbi:MAG: hypothetical protein ACLR0U_02425 [Enterocloster clostridioformis]
MAAGLIIAVFTSQWFARHAKLMEVSELPVGSLWRCQDGPPRCLRCMDTQAFTSYKGAGTPVFRIE